MSGVKHGLRVLLHWLARDRVGADHAPGRMRAYKNNWQIDFQVHSSHEHQAGEVGFGEDEPIRVGAPPRRRRAVPGPESVSRTAATRSDGPVPGIDGGPRSGRALSTKGLEWQVQWPRLQLRSRG